MSDDSEISGSVKASINNVFSQVLSEYPALALPAGVVFGLFSVATVLKAVVEGFAWTHRVYGSVGLFLAVALVVAISIVLVWIVGRAVAPRPKLHPLPAHYLSRSPIIKWDYTDAFAEHTRYELRAKLLKTGETTRIAVPERMHQIGIAGVTGEMEISVTALVAGPTTRRRRKSRPVTTEIYRDSVQRIRETGELRIAVHADPGEEIFCCFHNGEWQGFDIDLATLIASELETDPSIKRAISVEYCFYEWPAIIGAPNEHAVDMAIASISVSPERVKKYGITFSKPYAESSFGVVAYRHAFEGTASSASVSLDALRDKRIAVHADTTGSVFVERAAADPRYKDLGEKTIVARDNDELRELLRDNCVDAVITDYQRAFALLDTGAAVYPLDHDLEIPGDKYGIAFSRVNTALSDMVDGIIEKHHLKLATMLSDRTEHKRRAILFAECGPEPHASEQSIHSEKTNLFVYGSLMNEKVWRSLLTRDFERIGADLAGYRRLRIKHEDYPGLVKGVGVVRGVLWFAVDEENLRRLDEFEADCYERVSEVVTDVNGLEIQADCFRIRDSHRSVVEDVEWDEKEFAETGVDRFLSSYGGFNAFHE